MQQCPLLKFLFQWSEAALTQIISQCLINLGTNDELLLVKIYTGICHSCVWQSNLFTFPLHPNPAYVYPHPDGKMLWTHCIVVNIALHASAFMYFRLLGFCQRLSKESVKLLKNLQWQILLFLFCLYFSH